MGVSHIVDKNWGIYHLFWEGGVDSGRVAYGCLKVEGYIHRRRGIF